MKKGFVRRLADRRNKSMADGRGHKDGYEMEYSGDEVFYRVEESDRISNLSKKGRSLRSNTKPCNARFERGGESDTNLPRLRMRRPDPSKNTGKERKYLVRGHRDWHKDADFSKNGKSSDARLLTGKPTKVMRRVADGDVSDYGQSSRGYFRSKERSMKTEPSSVKIRFKTRKADGELAKNNHGDDAEKEEFEKLGVNKDGKSIIEQKKFHRPTRVLDKTGKMVRVDYKPLKNSSTETSASKKKMKRVIKLDPFDLSNKRLDDGVLKSEIPVEKDITVDKDVDVAVEKETAISMNAQFRAIQPSDEIFSFVEDNVIIYHLCF